jgi:endogenous inhibitor of DNA gyrase (YacG/DUF329 family)
MVSEVKCPQCGKKVVWTESSKWRPFCSERCKLIDLGDWFAEKNRLPVEESDQEEWGSQETYSSDEGDFLT